MTGFHQVTIGGYPGGGLNTDKKPFLINDVAFSALQNAYVWRDRVRKRIGEVGMGQLRRVFTSVSIGTSAASPWTFIIYSRVTPAITETNPQITPGSVIIRVGTVTYTDQGNGVLSSTTPGNSGTINYITGSVTLNTTEPAGTAATISFFYYPGLQSMGIWKLDTASIGIDQTIYFDTKYAYQFVGGGFQELTTDGTTWTAPNNANGTNTNFFWATNFQGATPNLRFFFATNDYINPAASLFDPIRYYNQATSTWTNLTPAIDATNFLFQSLILIPYYGRLLALNTWEGTAVGPGTVQNFFARVRFSQISNPVGTNSWRSDLFGLGGFLDAPTNEAIVGAAFYRNTLIVFFEYSTWQLRYIGEYGLPFIFERISSDFGAVSTFSPIIFDQGVMAVGDRGIIEAGAAGVTRLDEHIPDLAFNFEIQNNAPDFVHGARDFEKEVVYWNYIDESTAQQFQNFPNTTLLFNYRNNTWAQFRDTITCFGTGQYALGVTWDSQTTLWESNASWDDYAGDQFQDYILCGNQQGYISIYEQQDAETAIESQTMYAPSLAIKGVNFEGGTAPLVLTIPNHNLANGEIIYIQDMLWNGTDPGLNNQIYNVIPTGINTLTLGKWNGMSYTPVIVTSTATYIGGGYISLLPKMNIVGKDFSPFQAQGMGFKLSYIDFQADASNLSPAIPAVTIQTFVNSYLGMQANILVANKELIYNSQQVGFIQGATQSNPCQITSNKHSLATGQQIYIANVQGMTQLNSANYSITVVDANNFTLNGIDSSGFTVYINGGIWNSLPVDGQVYTFGAQYAWYRFYATQYGQYLRVAVTYDDELMNQLGTHQMPFTLNAMNFWFRAGGRIVN